MGLCDAHLRVPVGLQCPGVPERLHFQGAEAFSTTSCRSVVDRIPSLHSPLEPCSKSRSNTCSSRLAGASRAGHRDAQSVLCASTALRSQVASQGAPNRTVLGTRSWPMAGFCGRQFPGFSIGFFAAPQAANARSTPTTWISDGKWHRIESRRGASPPPGRRPAGESAQALTGADAAPFGGLHDRLGPG